MEEEKKQEGGWISRVSVCDWREERDRKKG